MNSEQLCALLCRIADTVEQNKQYLTELDAEIGDADHGVNMARGFAQVRLDCQTYGTLSCGEILMSVGKTLIKVIAGSSGSLYGSMVKVIGKTVGDSQLTYPLFIQGFEQGIEKIMAIGGAKVGEKTMLDSMLPALEALKADGNCKTGFEAAAKAAQNAAEHTKDYIATKGRASYVGERSLGHIDPGAQSFALIAGTVAEFLSKL